MPTSSSRFSDSGYGESSSCSGGGGLQSGTQLIEDFLTQETVNYNSVLYQEKCEDINSEGRFLGEARNDGRDQSSVLRVTPSAQP